MTLVRALVASILAACSCEHSKHTPDAGVDAPACVTACGMRVYAAGLPVLCARVQAAEAAILRSFGSVPGWEGSCAALSGYEIRLTNERLGGATDCKARWFKISAVQWWEFTTLAHEAAHAFDCRYTPGAPCAPNDTPYHCGWESRGVSQALEDVWLKTAGQRAGYGGGER